MIYKLQLYTHLPVRIHTSWRQAVCVCSVHRTVPSILKVLINACWINETKYKTYLWKHTWKGMSKRGKLCSSSGTVGVSSTSLYFPSLPKVVIKLSQLKGWSQKPLPCPVAKEASGVGMRPDSNSKRATWKGVWLQPKAPRAPDIQAFPPEVEKAQVSTSKGTTFSSMLPPSPTGHSYLLNHLKE